MNQLIVYGGMSLLGLGAKALYNLLKEKEQKRRMDPATWRKEDVALLVAKKKLEIAEDRVLRKALEEAMCELEGEGEVARGPRVV